MNKNSGFQKFQAKKAGADGKKANPFGASKTRRGGKGPVGAKGSRVRRPD